MTGMPFVSQPHMNAIQGDASASQNPVKKMQKNKGRKVAQLIGSHCMIACQLNGVQAQMLLDSGAQVGIIGKEWLQQNLPRVQIQPLETLLADRQLKVTAANGTVVPFEGWVEVLLEMTSAKHGNITIYVPMLVSQEGVDCLLLGFNVIEEIIRENGDTVTEVHLTDLLSVAMNLQKGMAEALVSTVNSDTSVVKTGKVGITIHRGQILNIRCRLKACPKGGMMMFELLSDTVSQRAWNYFLQL